MVITLPDDTKEGGSKNDPGIMVKNKKMKEENDDQQREEKSEKNDVREMAGCNDHPDGNGVIAGNGNGGRAR